MPEFLTAYLSLIGTPTVIYAGLFHAALLEGIK